MDPRRIQQQGIARYIVVTQQPEAAGVLPSAVLSEAQRDRGEDNGVVDESLTNIQKRVSRLSTGIAFRIRT